jgi:CRISPR/Cas system CMR-associated protein Cmr3 (group 5 of RAMP superfamily)
MYLNRTLQDAINLANKQRDELQHIVQVQPSDYDRIIMADRITELETAVNTLNNLWVKECKARSKAEYRVIELTNKVFNNLFDQ